MAVEGFLSPEFQNKLRSMMRSARGVSMKNFLSNPVFELAFHTGRLAAALRAVLENLGRLHAGLSQIEQGR